MELTMTRHVKNLGNQFHVSLPQDEHGFLGRECPHNECQRYFKIKPGTGLTGDNLPCHCPYCGHVEPADHFHTQSQIEYATSVVAAQFQNAVVRDLKEMANKFNRGSSNDLFSIKMRVRSTPASTRTYCELQLETDVQCPRCTLEYSVFGVFGFCPDCGEHNSKQIFEKNLDIIDKMIAMAESADDDLAEKLVENSLEDCVSAFDGFGRELCRAYSSKSSDAEQAKKISFQNLAAARQKISTLYAIDLTAGMPTTEWNDVLRAFQKRHLFAHKMGVVDKEYLDKTSDSNAIIGRKVQLEGNEVRTILPTLRKLAAHFASEIAR